MSKRRCNNQNGLSYMLPLHVDENRYSFTIRLNIKEAVKLSAEAENWMRERIEPKTAVKTCLALEEMLTGIVMANPDGRGTIDIVLRVEDEDVIISMRDMGVGFNPVKEGRELGIECMVYRADLSGRSDEAAARKARFECFRQALKETGADALLLAHNADDQAETFMMRLLRGAGADGLQCMAEDQETNGIRILRPMLGLGRDEIRDALRRYTDTLSEDST